MHGFSSHTLKWVNEQNETFFVKLNFRTDAGIENFTRDQAVAMASSDPDFSTRDLFNHINSGKTATWTLCVQIMPEKDAQNYEWNILDVTKVWPHKDYPLQPVGKLVLNRNPDNFFAEVEQSAFAPGHMVPGIEPTNDKMLQGRLFSYPDTLRHRLGGNFLQLPINCPYRTRVAHYQRDGKFTANNNGGPSANYEPNSFNGPKADPKFAIRPFKISGKAVRQGTVHPNSDFAQPDALFSRVMKDKDRDALIDNITGHLKNAKPFIQERQCKVFYKVNPEYGIRVAKGMDLNMNFSSKF